MKLDQAGRPYGYSIIIISYPISDFTGIFVTLSSGFLNTSGFEYRKVVPTGHTSPGKEFSFLRLKLYQRTSL
jgi:hypothetical protein